MSQEPSLLVRVGAFALAGRVPRPAQRTTAEEARARQ
jgi:hypothetical protein